METITFASIVSTTMTAPSAMQKVVMDASVVALSARFASLANTSVALVSPLQMEELP